MFNPDKNLPLIEGDRGRLKQVFLNLIKNAREAIEDKGEIIVITEFLHSYKNKGLVMYEDCVKIEVMDTGPGIPKENKERIFEPFFTTKKDGTGLGLAIIKSIVEGHRGFIEEVGIQGEGARFRVILPIRGVK